MKKIVLALSICLCFSAAFAQTPTATVTGQVKDPSGAIVVGATVTVTNIATDVSHTDTTNKDGEYTVSLLSPGVYTVQSTATGFKKELQSNVVLQIGQTARIDIALSLGAATDEVVVTAAEPLTDTEDATMGAVIDNKKVVELPLNGRNFFTLAYLVPGVFLPVANDTMGYRGGFNVAGSNEVSNYFTLDGFNNVDHAVEGPSMRPSVDAIQEFKLSTGTYEAEFGHNTGGQVIVTTKSGTNRFTGDVYEFIRNDALAARNYFTAAGAAKPQLNRNQFGGTFGGPIVRDKTFFFFSFEGLRLSNSVVLLETVPSPAYIGGNFTGAAALKTPAGYNPLAFANNVINPTYFTAAQLASYNVGKALLAYYPAPTNSNASNYNFDQNGSEGTNTWGLRLDQTFNAKDSLYATLNYSKDTIVSPYYSPCNGPYLPGFGCNSGLTTQLYGAGYTHVFTPNLLNTARGGFQRLRQPRTPLSIGIKFDQTYGIPAFNDPSVPADLVGSVPTTTVTGYQAIGGPNNLPQNRTDNTFDYLDTLLWNVGKHSAKFGAEFTRSQTNQLFVSYVAGGLGFTGTVTGNAVADTLLGLPATATQDPTAPRIHSRASYIAGFMQDEYKIADNLTLSYGLRWEGFTPITDTKNLQTTFNFAEANQLGAAAAQLDGTNGSTRHGYGIYNGDFGPRIGIAWQPFHNTGTVVRAGFGITYNAPALGNEFLAIENTYPIRVTSTFSTVTTSASGLLMLPNPFVTPASGNGVLSTGTVDHNYKPGMVNGYSFGIEHQLGRNTVLEVSYFGSMGSHLVNEINADQGSPSATAAGVVYPYPFWSYIQDIRSEGVSRYNSLLVRLERHFTNGLGYIASYSFAKSLDDTDGYAVSSGASTAYPQNSLCLPCEYGRSDFDVKSRFVFSPVYELPFGVGKPFLSNGALADIFGGFQISGIITQQTGTPFTSLDGANESYTNNKVTAAGYDRPNDVPGQDPNSGPKTPLAWFNTAAFQKQTAALNNLGTFGDEERNTIVGPGVVDVDMNFSRNFRLPRNMSLQVRSEFFNLFNHPIFGLPTNSIASASYNQITATNIDNREIQFGVKLYF